jgi:hypothetical protein
VVAGARADPFAQCIGVRSALAHFWS